MSPTRRADLDPDYSQLLWDRLREPDPTAGRKYDPARLRRAAGLVSDAGSPLQSRAARGHSPRPGWPTSWRAVGFPGHGCRPGHWPWTMTPSGKWPCCTLPQVGPVRELRHALGQLRLSELAVGPDGRNRCLLGAFGSKTGRNQPSNSAVRFGPSCWLRSLIRPGPGEPWPTLIGPSKS